MTVVILVVLLADQLKAVLAALALTLELQQAVSTVPNHPQLLFHLEYQVTVWAVWVRIGKGFWLFYVFGSESFRNYRFNSFEL